jgi:hypothetical protein
MFCGEPIPPRGVEPLMLEVTTADPESGAFWIHFAHRKCLVAAGTGITDEVAATYASPETQSEH